MRGLHLAILSGCLAFALAEAGEKCQESKESESIDSGKGNLARQLSSFEAYLNQDAEKRSRNETPEQSSVEKEAESSLSEASRVDSTGRGFAYHPAGYGPYLGAGYTPVQPSYLPPAHVASELRAPVYRPAGFGEHSGSFGYQPAPLLTPYQVAPLYYELLEYKRPDYRPHRLPPKRLGANRYGGSSLNSYKSPHATRYGSESNNYQTTDESLPVETSYAQSSEEQLASSLKHPLVPVSFQTQLPASPTSGSLDGIASSSFAPLGSSTVSPPTSHTTNSPTSTTESSASTSTTTSPSTSASTTSASESTGSSESTTSSTQTSLTS